MIDDTRPTPSEEGTAGTGSGSSKPKVDLFPALADRKTMPINSIRQPVPNRIGTQISIFTPISFEEALDIVECLRSRAATTINLDNMRKYDASRLVDFVAGASAALDGNFHQLSEDVYLFCPSNIKITAPADSFPKMSSSNKTNSLDMLFPSGNIFETEKSSTWANWTPTH